jgi:ankyrin repeat protein
LQSKGGYTALIYASQGRSVEIVKSLLDRGANPDLKTRAGKTALDFATKPEIKDLLTSYMKKE